MHMYFYLYKFVWCVCLCACVQLIGMVGHPQCCVCMPSSSC